MTTTQPEQTTAGSTIPEATTTDVPAATTTSPIETTPAACPIGQLEGDQIALVCPTGFRRHPKYCNLFYQCTSDPETYQMKILVMRCPNDTMYDDKRIMCLSPEETDQKCTGEFAQNNTLRRLEENNFSPVSIGNPSGPNSALN